MRYENHKSEGKFSGDVALWLHPKREAAKKMESKKRCKMTRTELEQLGMNAYESIIDAKNKAEMVARFGGKKSPLTTVDVSETRGCIALKFAIKTILEEVENANR